MTTRRLKVGFSACLMVAVTAHASSGLTYRTTIPANASLLFVEPVTMLQGAAAVVSIAGTLLGNGGSKKDITNRLTEISGKLDLIIQRQDVILAEILALKVYFNEALRESFAKEARIDFIALKNQVDVALAASSKAEQVASLKSLRGEAERVAFRMKEYGPASYQTAFASASVLAIVNHRTNLPLPQRRKAMSEISEKFGVWLQPTGIESVPQVRDHAVSARDATERDIAAFPRNHTWTIRSYVHIKCTVYVNREVKITGDLESGFVATSRDYEVHGTCEPGECRKCLVVRDFEQASAPYVAARKVTSQGMKTLAVAESSGLPPLDSIRSMHARWKEQVDDVARLEAMIANIELARKAIDAWGEA